MFEGMGRGAAKGLETLYARMREEEELAQAQEQLRIQSSRDAANQRNAERGLTIQEGTAKRLERSAELEDSVRNIQLGALRKLAGGETLAGSASVNPNVSSPSHETQVPAFDYADTPQNRTTLATAGQNPNEIFGTIAHPSQIDKSVKPPDDKEVFYRGEAIKKGQADGDWRALGVRDPQWLGATNKAWEENRPDARFPDYAVIGWDPRTNQGNWMSRSDAIKNNAPATPPGAQRDRIAAYESAISLLDEIERLGEEVQWKGLGPIAGRIGPLANEFGVGDWVSNNPQKEEQLRNKISQLKAQYSFGEGGKQFTGTEKEMIEAFLANLTGDVEQQLKPRLRTMRETMRRNHASLGQSMDPNQMPLGPTPGGPVLAPGGQGLAPGTPGGPGTAPAGESDYQRYLRRTKKPGGGQ